MSEVGFRVLGVVEADVGGDPVDLGPPRQRAVLAVLLVEAARVVPADQLVHRVWGESPPEGARRILSSYISRLRGALSGGSVEIPRRGGGYLLDVDPTTIDMHRYQQLVRQARAATDEEQAIGLWQQATALWQGEPFGDLDVPWLAQVRDRLAGQHQAALADYRDLRLRRGEHAELIPELQAAAGAYPLDERVAGQLMLALYRNGRQADALTHYDRLRRRLADELGSDPAPAVQRLHQQLLTSDPALAAPERSGPVDRDRAPVTLPWDTSDFTGRTPELAQLDACAAAPGRPGTAATAVVSGGGGIGKTALAVHWAHQPRTADRFPDGRLYVNLQGFSEQDPLTSADALRELLRQLGVPGNRTPSGLDSKREMYRQHLAGRRVLVLLDNATDSDQVRPLLVGSPGLALVTSRNRLSGLAVHEGATEVALERLPDGDASTLAHRLLGEDHPAATVLRLSTVCARLPLAIRLAATGFRGTHPDTSLASYLDQLEDDRIGLLDAGTDSGTALANVLSWSLRRLPGHLAGASRVIGLHPGPRVDLPAVAAMLDRTEQQARRVVRELAGASLLEETSPDRWSMHDLLREHARRSAPEAGIDPRTIHTRLLEHYTARLAAQPFDHRWFISEYPALMSCLRLPLDTEAAGRYTRGFAGRLLEYAYYADALRAYERVRQRVRPDSEAYAQSLYGMGRAANLLGAPRDQVVAHLTEAQRRFAALGDPAGEARTLRELTEVTRKRERYTYDRDRRALELFRQAGDAAGEADALDSMGRAAFIQGDYHASLDYASQAIDAATRGGSRRMVGRAHRVRGTALRILGDTPGAAAAYATALETAVEIADRGGESLVVGELIVFHLMHGRYEQAAAYGRRATALAGELGDRVNVAVVQVWMAQVHLARQELPQAAALLAAARPVFREHGHVSGQAVTDATEADLLLARGGDPEDAAVRYASAERALTASGYARVAAEARSGLGRGALAQGDRQQAYHHWKLALEMLETISAAQVAAVRRALDWLETGAEPFDPTEPLWMAG